MRTLLLLPAMAALAVVSGLSFVARAGARAPGPGELRVDCEPQPIVASAQPALLTCTAVAKNTGSATLKSAQLEFLPNGTVPPPDLYVFWSETHDGVRSVPDPVQLTYDFGDISPGASSTIVLEIIVQSTPGFAADVALVGQPDQWAYGRTTISSTAGVAATPSIPLTFAREVDAPTDMTAEWYVLAITNPGNIPYDSVTAELAPGTDIVVADPEWKAFGFTGRLAADFGPLDGHRKIQRALKMVPARQTCVTPAPVLVVTVVQGDLTRRQAAVDAGVLLGDCNVPRAAGTLPQGGSGPAAGGGHERLTAAALALGGALCLAMGATMRRRHRSG